ncbi:type I restriction enzyme HsdR N-terminal domain-containing protein [Pyrococcus yayanosii]|uniref:Hypothetical restriction endonuclease n=1 Tax=Pyrococcus yayanosii (strain CH1 / JCM 16557) TaxID=529709 RepID=F8AGD8_PYRYC|nr:type I restriction enzyme HsdR N-terminal domain-containing protein [Pyrococcus yayanosii]AEH25134.1 Hypothetical restriction endonuclease [Pyrococcus yayanosii CH1]
MLELLKDVVMRIEGHLDLYLRNEEAVKQHLILPVLRALGWNVEDPGEVRPEERTSEGRADYALIKGGRVVAFLEAKNLSVNVLKEDVLLQLGKYCFNMGVRYGIASNGAVWIAFKSFEEGRSLKDRILFVVDLREEPLERATLRLSLLSKGRIERLEELSRALRAIEEGTMQLKGAGIEDEKIVDYLLSLSLSGRAVPVDLLTGSERPKGVYVFEGTWKFIPLEERSVKGVLLAVLRFLASSVSEGKEKRALQKAYEELRVRPLDVEKVRFLLRGIEEEKGIRIRVLL